MLQAKTSNLLGCQSSVTSAAAHPWPVMQRSCLNMPLQGSKHAAITSCNSVQASHQTLYSLQMQLLVKLFDSCQQLLLLL